MDPIVEYQIRIPGHTAWGDAPTEDEAHAGCEYANQHVQQGHLVFALHKSGNVTGPYIKQD